MKIEYIKKPFKFIFLLSILFLSNCGGPNTEDDDTSLFKELKIHTFDNDVSVNQPYPKDLQELVLPLSLDGDDFLIFEVSLEDKLYNKRKDAISLKEFNKNNARLNLSKNISVSKKMLEGRYFDTGVKDKKPQNTHLIYSNNASLDEKPDTTFNYFNYYKTILEDNHNLVYILSADGSASETDNVFSSVSDLRTAVKVGIKKFPTRKIIIVYKPAMLPADKPVVKEDCNNNSDDDGDGAIDCEDGDCPPCPPDKEKCADGIDNDGDGLVDCADKNDCYCENCNNGIDDNGDGKIDCADPKCKGKKECPETKPKEMKIMVKNNTFIWNSPLPGSTYDCVFSKVGSSEVSWSKKTKDTQIPLPTVLQGGEDYNFKVTAYNKDGNILMNKTYSFSINLKTRAVESGCPTQQEKN